MDFQNPFWLNFCFETGLELKGHSTIEANTCVGMYGYLLVFMSIYGYLQVFMGIYGYKKQGVAVPLALNMFSRPTLGFL